MFLVKTTNFEVKESILQKTKDFIKNYIECILRNYFKFLVSRGLSDSLALKGKSSLKNK